jgi:nucleoside-diphosphate-sugar epimerase
MDDGDDVMATLFCFGLGYSAKHLAAMLEEEGWHIAGTARTPDGVERIQDLGYMGYVFDGLSAGAGSGPSQGAGPAARRATHILISAPPDAGGDPVLRYHADDIAASNAEWIGYLSTIGVYGDHSGGWVDETTPVTPSSDRSRRRAVAEQQWLDFGRASGKRVEIFRLAGIYGPGSSAIDSLKSGISRSIVKKDQVFNRIHVDDIARVLLAALSRPHVHAIYNVTDDEPAPPQDVNAYAAQLLGLPPPVEIAFEEAALSEMARSFYAENKRVRNDRIKTGLGVELEFPTYREGLAAIAAASA